jgi:hypothetical protein
MIGDYPGSFDGVTIRRALSGYLAARTLLLPLS